MTIPLLPSKMSVVPGCMPTIIVFGMTILFAADSAASPLQIASKPHDVTRVQLTDRLTSNPFGLIQKLAVLPNVRLETSLHETYPFRRATSSQNE